MLVHKTRATMNLTKIQDKAIREIMDLTGVTYSELSRRLLQAGLEAKYGHLIRKYEEEKANS